MFPFRREGGEINNNITVVSLPLGGKMMESYIHSDLKIDWYCKLLQNDMVVNVEKTIGQTRTDILTEINDHLCAIEIQHSPISVNEIVFRMKEHTKIGAHTLWIISKDLLNGEYSRNLKWVNFIQLIQNGVIFLPSDNQQILPARIDNSLKESKGNIVAGRKMLDCYHSPIDIDQILFEKNETYDLNITTFEEWWISSYLEF